MHDGPRLGRAPGLLAALLLMAGLVACATDQEDTATPPEATPDDADAAASPEPAPDDAGTATDEPAEPAEIQDVNVVAIEGNQLFPLRVIEWEGFDEANGVRMNLNAVAGPQALYPAMQQEDFNLGFGIWVTHANMREGGVPLTNVYSASMWKNDVIVAEDSDIESLDDLRGRNVGIYGTEASGSTIFFQYLVQKAAGFDILAEANITYGAGALMAAQLEQGELDAALLPDPQITGLLAESDGFRSIIDTMEAMHDVVGSDPLWVTLVANEQWAADNPDAVRGFIAAYRDAMDYLTEEDGVWPELAASVNIHTDEGAGLLRDRIREQFLDRWDDELVADMHELMDDILTTLGEVGPLPTAIPEGTFTTDYGPQ